MPDDPILRVELCLRLLDSLPCFGQVYRPQPGVIKCRRCGSETGGRMFVPEPASPPSAIRRDPMAHHPLAAWIEDQPVWIMVLVLVALTVAAFADVAARVAGWR